MWFIPLSFGLDFIIQAFRFSFIFGKYYFGVALDPLRFFGFSFTTPFNLEVVNQDFSSAVSSALLRFDFNKIWDNLYLSLIAYPLLHILLGLGGGYLIANHIKLFSTHKNLRLEPKNGITLCKGCDKKIYKNEEKFEKLFMKIVKKIYGKQQSNNFQ